MLDLSVSNKYIVNMPQVKETQMDGYITVDEAAQLTGKHPNTIRNHVKRGTLPNTFIKGHIVLIFKDDLKQLQKESA